MENFYLVKRNNMIMRGDLKMNEHTELGVREVQRFRQKSVC